MKKLFLYVFLVLLWCNVGFTEGTWGIKQLYLIVEDVDEKGEKQCLITRKDIETRIKYIIANSKLELTSDFGAPILWFQPIIIGDEYTCSGVLYLRIHQHTTYSKHNPKGFPVSGPFVFYEKSGIAKNTPSKFKDYYLSFVDDLARQLVVDWHEDNK